MDPMAGGVADQPDEADGGAVAMDPLAIVEGASEDGMAVAEGSHEPTPPEKAALVADWWKRTSQTADFEAAVDQVARDLETLEGGTGAEVDAEAEVTVAHVYRNAIQSVALTVPSTSDVTWRARKMVEPLPGDPIPPEFQQEKRRRSGLAAVVTMLVQRFAEQGNLQEKIEAWVQDSVHFPMAIAKVWWQSDLALDPITESRLADEQDLLARARVLIEGFDRGEFTRDDARAAELRQVLGAIGKTEADIHRGIAMELRPLANYRCDPAVTGPEYIETAAWESDDVLLTRDQVLAKWPDISADDLQSCAIYQVDAIGRAVRQEREAKTRNDDVQQRLDLPGNTAASGHDWLLCREIYDYRANTRLVLIEGLEFPAVEAPLERSPIGMSPFVVLVENRKPRSLYGYSDTQLQAKIQKQLNRLRSQEEDARRNAQPRYAYDPAVIDDPKIIKSLANAEPWTFIPVPVSARGALKDAIVPLQGNHDYNPSEYDGGKLVQELRKMAMLPEQASGELGQAEFSSEVQVAAAGANALARYRQTRITRALSRLYDKFAQLIVQNLPQQLAIEYCGPMASLYYPQAPLGRMDVYRGLEIKIDVQLDKQLDYAKRADSLAKFMDVMAKGGVTFDRETSAKLLGMFMGVDDASDLILPDPNELVARLQQAMTDGKIQLIPQAAQALLQLAQQAVTQLVQAVGMGGGAPGGPGAPPPGGAPGAPPMAPGAGPGSSSQSPFPVDPVQHLPPGPVTGQPLGG